jgi:hypothetical protein
MIKAPMNISGSLRSFQYHFSKLYRTVDAPTYTETNYRFYNTEICVLLILQFIKVLISVSPYKLVALCYGAQCHVESADIQRYSEQWERDEY